MSTSKKATAKKAPAKKANAVPSPSPVSLKEQDKWQAEDDARILMRAEEIKADKARMAKAKGIVSKQAAAAARIVKS